MHRPSHRIAVLTSGGDSPGMNACLRAVVRSAIFAGYEVVGIQNGYEGLIHGKVHPLMIGSVGNIIQRGGTILGTSRSESFRLKAGRAKAYEHLKNWKVRSLIVMGGDGTMMGAKTFSQEYPVNVIGIPCTIDNDLYGTEFCIGFDTAVNTAVECIDKIRDTANSHGRVFVVEVMGRNTGHMALETALAGGAEYVVVPEAKFQFEKLVKKIQAGIERGKTGSIIVVAERDQPGWALEIADLLRRRIRRDVRASILGHLQRGGSPSTIDRNLASRLGAKAVELAIHRKNRMMVGFSSDKIGAVSFDKVIGKRRAADLQRFELVDRLSI